MANGVVATQWRKWENAGTRLEKIRSWPEKNVKQWTLEGRQVGLCDIWPGDVTFVANVSEVGLFGEMQNGLQRQIVG